MIRWPRSVSRSARLRATLEPEIARWEAAIGETLAEQHTPTEIVAFRTVLFTLIAAFPDGDDLWAARSARWDKRLDTLKTLLEAEHIDERAKGEA